MNRNKPRICYDKAGNVLSIEMNHGKSVDSDIQGNIVLDYDRKGKIVRINLYQFDFDAFRKSRRTLQRCARSSLQPARM